MKRTGNHERVTGGNGSRTARCADCSQFPHTEWHELPHEDLAVLCAMTVSRHFAAGQALFLQGEANTGLFCVQTGTVALRQLDESGNSVLLSLAYPGDVLGYRSLLANEDHKVSAEALGPCQTCKVARSTALQMIQRHPGLGLAFLRRSSREIERLQEALVRAAGPNNRARLLQVLAELLEHHGESQGGGVHCITLPVSRRDLASMIGTRHETLSRLMSRIEGEELARFSGRKVLIPNLAAFVDAAYSEQRTDTV